LKFLRELLFKKGKLEGLQQFLWDKCVVPYFRANHYPNYRIWAVSPTLILYETCILREFSVTWEFNVSLMSLSLYRKLRL